MTFRCCIWLEDADSGATVLEDATTETPWFVTEGIALVLPKRGLLVLPVMVALSSVSFGMLLRRLSSKFTAPKMSAFSPPFSSGEGRDVFWSKEEDELFSAFPSATLLEYDDSDDDKDSTADIIGDLFPAKSLLLLAATARIVAATYWGSATAQGCFNDLRLSPNEY